MPENHDVEPNGRRTRAWARIRSVLARRSIAIPIILIAVMTTFLAARTAVQTWIDWTFESGNPHAEVIPDSADFAITARLDRLAAPGKRNAVNEWRHAATGSGQSADDWPALVERRTGRALADADLEEWAGRRASVFWTADGMAMVVDVRDIQAATDWIDRENASSSIAWVSESRLWIADNSEVKTTIDTTREGGQRSSISSSADYRRSRDTHAMKRQDIEVFMRWRGVDELWTQRVAAGLDCKPTAWLSARVRIEEDGMQPEKAWTARTLPRRDHHPRQDGALAISTTYPTRWSELDARLRSQTPATAEILAVLKSAIDDGEGSAADLLAGTDRVATMVLGPTGRWSIEVGLNAQNADAVDDTMGKTIAAIAGRWGAQAAVRDGADSDAHRYRNTDHHGRLAGRCGALGR